MNSLPEDPDLIARATEAAARSANGKGGSRAETGDLGTLARGGLLNLAGAVAYGLFNLLLVIVVTRGLRTGRAGAFFEAVALFTIASNAVELGADTGLIRFVARYRALGRTSELRTSLRVALVPVFLAGVVVAVAGLVFAPHLSELFARGQRPEAIAPYIRILSPFVPISAAYTVAVAATRGFGTMVPSVTVDKIGRPVVQTISCLIVVVLGMRSAAIAFAYVGPIALAFALAIVWLLWLLRRAERRDPAQLQGARSGRAIAAEFWRFTAPRGFAAVFQVSILWLGTLMVGVMLSARDAAIYTGSSRFVVIGSIALMAIVQVIGPQISDLLTREHHARAEVVYQTATWWLMITTWPVYLTMAVFAPLLLKILGHDYQQGATVLVILSLAMLISMASGPVDVVLLMGGKSSWSLINMVVSLSLNIALNLILIPRLGIEGAALAWAVSIAVNNLAPLAEVWLFMKLNPFGPGFAVAAISAVSCFGGPGLLLRLTLGTKISALALLALVGGGLYLALLWRFREVLQLSVFRSAIRVSRPRSRAGAKQQEVPRGTG